VTLWKVGDRNLFPRHGLWSLFTVSPLDLSVSSAALLRGLLKELALISGSNWIVTVGGVV